MKPIDTEPIIGSVQSMLSRDRSRITKEIFRKSPMPLNIHSVACHWRINRTFQFPGEKKIKQYCNQGPVVKNDPFRNGPKNSPFPENSPFHISENGIFSRNGLFFGPYQNRSFFTTGPCNTLKFTQSNHYLGSTPIQVLCYLLASQGCRNKSLD